VRASVGRQKKKGILAPKTMGGVPEFASITAAKPVVCLVMFSFSFVAEQAFTHAVVLRFHQPCKHCERKFNPKSLARHEGVCQAAKPKTTKTFNARKKRMQVRTRTVSRFKETLASQIHICVQYTQALAQLNGVSKQSIRKIAQKVRQEQAVGSVRDI